MVLILTVLTAFPLGYLLRNRMAAYLAYGLAFAHVFTFQTAQLVLEAVRGSQAAFGDLDDPAWDWFGDTIGYLVVTSLIYAVGMALVTGGSAVARRRVRRLEDVSVG